MMSAKFVYLLLPWAFLSGITIERAQAARAAHTYPVSGIVKALDPDSSTITVQHREVAGFMPAMTMPFRVKDRHEISKFHIGDEVSFTLQVTDTDSWVEDIRLVGSPPAAVAAAGQKDSEVTTVKPEHPLMQAPFTNQLGQIVRLRDFQGQALAITFFFTRCPVPNFCPRLSKNFQEASQKLLSRPSAPTNWHFLSITFDPKFDTPSVLEAYSKTYDCDPAHWSFLTGSMENVAELAKQSNVQFERDGVFFNHNFRTLVIDAAGHLQMTFPIGGNLSDALVEELLKAATVDQKTSQQ